jgi:hypothetical protein
MSGHPSRRSVLTASGARETDVHPQPASAQSGTPSVALQAMLDYAQSQRTTGFFVRSGPSDRR